MKANELRIGNYVWHKGNEWSYRNDEVSINGFEFQWIETDWYALVECTLSLKDIEPIPLTEEWLLKFGFKSNINKDSGCGYSYVNDFSIWVDNGKLIYWKVKGSVELKNVHQLQNLYFSLTGKELEIKQNQ